MASQEDCPRASTCANAGIKCHICTRFSCYVEGKPQRRKGAQHEKQVQKLRNASHAYLRPGSGSLDHSKGDLIDDQALHEAKSGYTRYDARGHASFSLKREWLLKIARESLVEGKLPILEFHYDGTPDEEIWAVVSASALFDLLDRVREIECKDQPPLQG